MSQAICAPSTGDPVVAPDKSGKNIGRRSVLAALALAPAVVAIAAPAADASTWEDPALRSRRVDAAFWRAHSRERRLYRQWMASFERMRGSPLCDAVTGNWCARHSLAEAAVMLSPVSTLPALHAKMEIVRAAEVDCEMRLDCGLTPQDVLLFDVERMVKAEYQA